MHTLTLGANLNTGSGDIDLTGLIVLSGSSGATSTVTLTGDDIDLSGSINGDGVQTRSLTIVGSGDVALGGIVTNDIGNTNPIGDLSITATGLTVNAGTITPVAGSKFTLISATPDNRIAIRSSSTPFGDALVVRTSTLDKFSGFASINLGQGGGLTHLLVGLHRAHQPQLQGLGSTGKRHHLDRGEPQYHVRIHHRGSGATR